MNNYRKALEDIGCKVNSTDIECHICKDIRGNGECSFDFVNSFGTLHELVENHEKYRWHDLRKKPNDLPSINKEVYICYNFCGNKYHCLNRMIDEKTWNVEDNARSMRCHVEVIAWKYIEPFEE